MKDWIRRGVSLLLSTTQTRGSTLLSPPWRAASRITKSYVLALFYSGFVPSHPISSAMLECLGLHKNITEMPLGGGLHASK